MNKLLASALIVLLCLSFAAGLVGVWRIKPVYAASLFSDGFESGNFGAWDSYTGSATVVGSPVHSGAYAGQFVGYGAYVRKTLAANYTELYMAGEFRTSTLPVTGGMVLFLSFWNLAYSMSLLYGGIGESSGTTYFGIHYRNTDGNWVTDLSTVTCSVNTWYNVEMKYLAGAKPVLYVDNSTALTGSVNAVNSDCADVRTGLTYNDQYGTLFVDDVIVDDERIGESLGGATLSVTLLAPQDHAMQTEASATFYYIPTIVGGTIQNASLWLNYSGTWQKKADNASVVTSGVSNGISFTFTANATYVWNIKAYNTTHGCFASANRTLTVYLAEEAPPDVFDINCKYLVTLNATKTYLWNNVTGLCIDSDVASVSLLNRAITTANGDSSNHNIYVYNGSYSIAGTVQMKPNVVIVLQDNVNFTETAASSILVLWTGFSGVISSNAWLLAENHARFVGTGTTIESCFVNYNDYGPTLNVTIKAFGTLEVCNWGGVAVILQRVTGWTLENIWVHDAILYYTNNHIISLDQANECELINVVSDGLNGAVHGESRSTLTIGGQEGASNNINITGGTYKNAYYDNGIYLGGWIFPVTNLRIVNVTTENNNAAHTAHSGLKFRPASNVTVINWTSNYDFNGIEMDSSADSESSVFYNGGSWYNYVQGTINFPFNSGAALDLYGSDEGQSNCHNVFNLTINNCTGWWDGGQFKGGGGFWLDNGYAAPCNVSYNTFYLTVTGCERQAVMFSDTGVGEISFNTFYCTFLQNGKGGYNDIDILLMTNKHNNTFNVYYRSGNPNALMGFVNGTNDNFVYYPYVIPPAAVTVTVTNPQSTTYVEGSIPVQFVASGGVILSKWWNCKNGTSWVYASNITYTGPTWMLGFINGTDYYFYAWANNTGGSFGETIVPFMVGITITRHWQFTFAHRDMASLSVDTSVTLHLHNGTQLLSYIEGAYTLLDGTYTLETFYLAVLVDTKTLSTVTYGNTTITVNLAMRALATGGYVAVNKTATITIRNETSTFINVTLTASGTFQTILKVPRNATIVQLNSANLTTWFYDVNNVGIRANITSGNLSLTFTESLGDPWFAVTVSLVTLGGVGGAVWFYRRSAKKRSKEIG